MTVAELIAALSNFDETEEVYFAHPSHDYWRTELASPAKYVDIESIKHSEYHRQMTTTDKDDCIDAVVIRT